MSISLIDHFVFTNSELQDTDVEVFFDTDTLDITYDVTSGALDGDSVTEVQRGRSNGDDLGGLTSGDTIYNLVVSNHIPFAEIGSTEPVIPIPPQCDLDLKESHANETSSGANDGAVTLTATSSFPPIKYSIDGVNFTFATFYPLLAPGNYTAYTSDNNGCTKNVPFEIQAFDNPIDGGFAGGLPQVEVSAGNISRWNAAFNPVVLKFFIPPDPAKVNVRIEIEISSVSGIITGRWSPDVDGKIRCDISSYLQIMVNANDGFKYDVLTWNDVDRWSGFVIRYREVWDGFTGIWYSAPNLMYVTYSAKQLGDKYGGNMAEYVPFLVEPNPDFKAKFLTLFDIPTAWGGLPFDVSFILSEYVENENIKLRTISLDINKQPFGGETFGYILNNNDGYVLGSEAGRLIIQQASLPPVSTNNVLGLLGINRLMMAGSAGIGVEYFKIQLFTGPDDAPNFITQPLLIKVNKQCIDPYIYLKWLNTLGGWDYWRFGHDQITQLSTADQVSIDRNVFDWENGDTIADTIKKSAITKISIGATVSNLKLEGLTGLHKSVKVQMLTKLNPYKWQTVTLNTGSFDIKRAKNNYSDLKFSINLPEINIQSQ